jgi:type II secretory pathway component GspD/PulD (secretin)
MRWRRAILAVALFSIAAFCADQPGNPSVCSASNNATGCPSKKVLKEARSAYKHALKLEDSNQLTEALAELDKAAQLAPGNPEYLTAREMLRQQLAFDHVKKGNAQANTGRSLDALAEFRAALELDPQNSFAQQRLRDVTTDPHDAAVSLSRILSDSGEIVVQPDPLRADFHYRGDSRALITQVAEVYGISVVFDDSVVSRPVRFDINSVGFETAMEAAGAVTKSFWTPLSSKQILVAADNPEKHRDFDRAVLRTFYLPNISPTRDLAEMANLLRSMFDLKMVTPQPGSGTLVVRAPERTLDAVAEFLERLDTTRPQVMLDIRVYEVSHTFMRNMGLHLPTQFQMFNIPVGALAALGGQNIQQLINQLIAGGGINQANSTAISGLLQQLQSQQSSIFSQPVVTFGNGLTLMGLSLGNLSAQLSTNESWVKNLEQGYLRTSQGDDATFKIGSRYPILNASFAPIFNTPAISQVVQNNSFQAPFPSFNYEDLGLVVKAKTTVNGNSDVTLALEMQLRTLVGKSFNGVPVIANQEYKGTTQLREGQSTVLVGAVSRNDIRSMSGIPGLGSVTGLNKLLTQSSKEIDEDELMVVVTPRVLANRDVTGASLAH